MPENTLHYKGFSSGISKRRQALLRNENGEYFFPRLGTEWNPDFIETTKCDAFILFFVAELENYLEGIIKECITIYRDAYEKYFLKDCQAGKDYMKSSRDKLEDVNKNHNANWEKVRHLFSFIGMKKEAHFPKNYWDKIDGVVKHRGHIAHKGMYLRQETDRRILIKTIDEIEDDTNEFDKRIFSWLNSINDEIERIKKLPKLSFPEQNPKTKPD